MPTEHATYFSEMSMFEWKLIAFLVTLVACGITLIYRYVKTYLPDKEN